MVGDSNENLDGRGAAGKGVRESHFGADFNAGETATMHGVGIELQPAYIRTLSTNPIT